MHCLPVSHCLPTQPYSHPPLQAPVTVEHGSPSLQCPHVLEQLGPYLLDSHSIEKKTNTFNDTFNHVIYMFGCFQIPYYIKSSHSALDLSIECFFFF